MRQTGALPKEAGFGFSDDINDRAAQIAQRGRDWLSGNGRIVAERYLDGQLSAKIRFLWKEKVRVPKIYYGVAVIQELSTAFDSNRAGSLGEVDLAEDAAIRLERNNGVPDCYWRNHAVLVDDIEMMEGIQSVVPSLIRFQIVDELAELGGAFPQLVFGDLRVVAFRGRDREIDAVAAMPVHLSGGAGEMVEGAAHVVDRIASGETEINRDRFVDVDIDTLNAALCVKFGKKGIRGVPSPGFNSRLKILDVIECPVDLGIDALEASITRVKGCSHV